MALAMGWHKPDNVAGSSAPAIMVGSFVATGGVLFGYDTGCINGLVAMPAFRKHFGTEINADGAAEMTTYETSMIVAMLSFGTFLGALLAAPFGDCFGRRLSLIGAVGVFCVGAMFQVGANRIPLLLVGRFFAGIGVGIVSVLVPLYQSEMAPKWIRGTLVCAYQLFITVGLLTAAVVNVITSNIPSSAAFRIPMGLQIIWAVVLALGLFVLPETPRYLVKRGRKPESALSLSRLRRLDITHPAILEELAEIEANHEYELGLGPDSYKDIICGSPHLGRRTLTGCGLQMLQQLSGINFLMYYGTTFFINANVSDPFIIALIMQIINTLSTIPGLVVVETWGRRKLLIVGAIGMSVCQLLIASLSAAVGDSIQLIHNQVLITLVSLYIFFFAASWGPVVWVVTSEIYPLKVRAKAMSVSTSSNWLLNFGIAYGSPFMVDSGRDTANLGAKVFFFWGAFCLLAIAFVWGMVFETSKMSLEQIDEMYERVDYAWNSQRFEPSWSFQQILHLGYSDSGIPPQNTDTELQPTSTISSSNSHSGPGATLQSSTQDNKALPDLGHVEFSY